ncbi:MAG: hypothetical protein K8T90_20640 [Planctomycetes bacterium]|nr:hypothetical protein [Planctomycetota bacterium]
MADRISAVDGALVEGARTVEAAATRLKDKVVTGTQEKFEVSRDYISENPVKSVLVAVGVGALLGYLLGRRTS